jgi:hypothetical protein
MIQKKAMRVIASLDKSLDRVIESTKLQEMAWKQGRSQYSSNKSYLIEYCPERHDVTVYDGIKGGIIAEVSEVQWTKEDFSELAAEFQALSKPNFKARNGDYETWEVMVRMNPVDALNSME